jgi:hypothetical protein
MTTTLTANSQGHVHWVLVGLAAHGWSAERLPEDGRVARNRQRLILRTDDADHRFRLHIYSVTGSSRGQPLERRIEITTTYAGTLAPDPDFRDVVMGFDREAHVFVGFDARRLEYGGPTHNASSFFSASGLRPANSDSLIVLEHDSGLFGVERHAYFRDARLAEYLLNCSAIHAGTYSLGGRGSAQRRRRAVSLRVDDDDATGDVVVLREPAAGETAEPPAPVVAALESGIPLPRRRVSPRSLQASLRRAEENGLLGEDLIYRGEITRLKRAGALHLAERVDWISQVDVAAGYDIASFEIDGTPKYVEVKSTQGGGMTFPMSLGEWRAAERHRDQFEIARVRHVRSAPLVDWFVDPVQMEVDGRLRRDAETLRVTIDP